MLRRYTCIDSKDKQDVESATAMLQWIDFILKEILSYRILKLRSITCSAFCYCK